MRLLIVIFLLTTNVLSTEFFLGYSFNTNTYHGSKGGVIFDNNFGAYIDVKDAYWLKETIDIKDVKEEYCHTGTTYLDVGVMYKLPLNLHIFGGVGFKSYKVYNLNEHNEFKIELKETNYNFNYDVGVMYKIGHITFSLGYEDNSMLGGVGVIGEFNVNRN